MKKLIKSTIIIGVIMLSAFFANAQVSTANNFGVAANYVGWDAAQAFPLNIQHLNNFNMNFRTNFAAAPVGAGNRMIILNGGFGPGGGQIAMGNNLPNAFAPQGRLHLHHNVASNVSMRFTHAGTGLTATDGFQIGVDPAVTGANPLGLNVTRMNQWELAPMQFWLPNGFIPRDRLHIFS